MAIRDLIPWRKKVPVRQEAEEYTSLQNQMDRVFDEFWRGFGLSPLYSSGAWTSFSPNVDIVETDQAIEIQAELPGMDEKDISVTLSGRTLTISGEKKQEREETRGNTTYAERSYGSFQRALTLPEDVKVDQSEAVFKRGVLHITFPKTAEAKKKITIKAG